MPRTFFDLNLLANMVAKLGNIVGEHVKFDMFANNVGQFGHTLKLMAYLQIFSISNAVYQRGLVPVVHLSVVPIIH